MRVNLLAIAAVLMLSACASKYFPPTEGPTASVTYRSGPQVKKAGVFMYERDDCERIQYIGTVGNTKHTNLGTLVGSEEQATPEKTVMIPAGGQFINHFRQHFEAGYCSLTIRFSPVPRQAYDVLINGDGFYCSAQVFRVDSTGMKFPEPTVRKTERQCRF